ncbi:MAG: diacylglycerol kinase family lipid kinase [Rhodospirillales bacterium]|nr:diacylglycerol kinase family lipid kinase [Rhodospirillales bacterium]MCW9039218.1 diacylglycerol kinase family lipid kinase [Rhodospirillales bacterium]
MRTLAVVNPHSGNDRAGRDWPEIKSRLADAIGPFDTKLTTKTGEGIPLIREGVAAGYKRIIAVGGDGTANEAVNGMLADDGSPISEDAVLGIINHGTGNDLRRSLSIEAGPEAAIAAIAEGHIGRFDIVRSEFFSFDGQPVSRLFVNDTTIGLGGRVARIVNRGTHGTAPLKSVSGKLAFYWATLVAVSTYREPIVRIEVDGTLTHDGPVTVAAVCNSRHLGGGMFMAPHAKTDDGVIDLVAAGGYGLLGVIGIFPKLYKGTHLGQPRVSSRSGGHITMETQDEVWIEMDGESPGKLPASFRVIPGALRMFCAKPSI